MQSRERIPHNATDDYNGRNSYEWNPLTYWRAGEEHLRTTAEEECQKINSYSNTDFYKYVKMVTGSKIGWITYRYWESIIWFELDGVAPEVLSNTVQSILDCIKSRLEGK